mmetsp:Transcript_20469/g.36331  ORF Transcript_20469/g.36331 Transcript_20469/m.36331 type:complete len:273 (-) Transcript_20469:208-1026(-)
MPAATTSSFAMADWLPSRPCRRSTEFTVCATTSLQRLSFSLRLVRCWRHCCSFSCSRALCVCSSATSRARAWRACSAASSSCRAARLCSLSETFTSRRRRFSPSSPSACSATAGLSSSGHLLFWRGWSTCPTPFAGSFASLGAFANASKRTKPRGSTAHHPGTGRAESNSTSRLPAWSSPIFALVADGARRHSVARTVIHSRRRPEAGPEAEHFTELCAAKAAESSQASGLGLLAIVFRRCVGLGSRRGAAALVLAVEKRRPPVREAPTGAP